METLVTYGEFGLQQRNRRIYQPPGLRFSSRLLYHRHVPNVARYGLRFSCDKTRVNIQTVIGTRQGSGKGSEEYWVAVVKPGRVMFEMGGIPAEAAKECYASCRRNKLPT
ncbi:MAG: ribosomal protein L16 [Dialister invisus]